MYKSYEINAETKRVEEERMNKLTEIKESIERLTDVIYSAGMDEESEELREIFNEILSLLEEKDKALEWANRIIGSGLDVGAELRYDPRQWLTDYHTSSNNEGEMI